MANVLISGANGFLGSHITKLLVKNNHHVTCLVRENSDIHFIERYNCTILKVNYDHLDNVFSNLNDIDFYIHNAAMVMDWGDYNKFYKINCELTSKLIKLAHLNNIKNIIHISSNAVLGEEDCVLPKDQDAPHRPKLPYFLEKIFPSGMNNYRITKSIGEKIAIELSQKHKSNLIVLRPVWIFGPREFNAGPYEYCKIVKDKIPFFPGTTKNLFHVVYVEDIAQSIIKMIEKKLTGINIYNIGAKNIPTMHNFYKIFCKNLNVKIPLSLPKFILYPFVISIEALYIIFKIKTPPILTRARLYMFYANNVYNVSKIENDLDIDLTTNFEQNIRKTIKWWKLNGYL